MRTGTKAVRIAVQDPHVLDKVVASREQQATLRKVCLEALEQGVCKKKGRKPLVSAPFNCRLGLAFVPSIFVVMSPI